MREHILISSCQSSEFFFLKKMEGGPNKFQALPNRKCLTFDNCRKGEVAEEGDGGQQKHQFIWNFLRLLEHFSDKSVWLNHSWSDHDHFLPCNFTVNWPKVFKEVEASLKRSSGICTQGRRQEDLRSVLWSLKDIFQQSILRTSLPLNKPFSKTNVYV